MRWEDESYVKMYTRETADMLLWPWQATALWPQLLKKADNSGLLDTGRKDPIGALALLVRLPREVVEPAVAALLADGCLEEVVGGYLIRNFVEAQSARKTEAQKKRDYRQRQRDKRRSQDRVIPSVPVPTLSPPGPQGVPRVSTRSDPPSQAPTSSSTSASASTQSLSPTSIGDSDESGQVEEPKRRRGESPAQTWFRLEVEPERARKLAEENGITEAEVVPLVEAENLTPQVINSLALRLTKITSLPRDRESAGAEYSGLTLSDLWWDYLDDARRAGTKTAPYSFRYFATEGVVLELLNKRKAEDAA